MDRSITDNEINNNEVTDEPFELNIPFDYKLCNKITYSYDYVESKIDADTIDKLKICSKEKSIPLDTLLLSFYMIMLGQYGTKGNAAIYLGTVELNDNKTYNFDNIVSYLKGITFTHTIEQDMEYGSFLESIHKSVIRSFENHKIYKKELSDETENSKLNLLHTAFISSGLLDEAEGNMQNNNIQCSGVHEELQLYFFPFVRMHVNGSCMIELFYNRKLYKQATMNRMVNHFVNIAKTVANNPRIMVQDIELLTESEKKQILFDFNNTTVDYPKDRTICQMFEEQVVKTPDNIAVIFEDRQLTYNELNIKANRLARKLRNKDVKANSIIGIMLQRSIEMEVGILAILKAGGAYLPIDPHCPYERINYMLEDSGATILLVDDICDHAFHVKAEVLNIANSDFDDEDESNLSTINTPRDLAYTIYTSGSTGRPKGVMIEHHSLVNRIVWMQKQYPIDENDVILQKTTFVFDVSVWELLWWSITGASLCFLKPGREKDPRAIAKAIEKYKITTLHFVPSILSLFLEYIEDKFDLERIRSLRQVFASGEALGLQQVYKFNNTLYAKNNTKLINLYGPTEATVDVSFFDCSAVEKFEVVPIGKPIDNIKLYIIDKYNKILPIGIPGELCIAGVGVARGYLNRPVLNEEKFMPNPFHIGEKMYKTGDLAKWLPDGNIEFLGRADFQVKIRGLRIELGEIEYQILNSSVVKEAVVVVKEGPGGNKYLCAYLVADKSLQVECLIEFLKQKLPEYMIPNRFIQLDRMKLTENGKVDKKALAEIS